MGDDDKLSAQAVDAMIMDARVAAAREARGLSSSAQWEEMVWQLIEVVAANEPSRYDLKQALEHVWNHTYYYEGDDDE